MIKIYNKNGKDKTPLELAEFRPNSWVHIERPTEQELSYIAEEFSLDLSLLYDAIDIHEVPRVEVEDGVVYIFSRFVYSDGTVIDTTPMLIALKKDALITVTHVAFPKMQNLLNGRIDYSTGQRVKLLIKLFGQISDTYNDYLNSLSKRLRSLSFRVENIKNRDIIQFVEFENILYDFNSSIIRINATLNYLHTGKIVKLTENEKDLIEDLSLAGAQLVQITQESLRNIANIREAYSTIMTNNLNRIIKLFTSLTVILTIPTIIGTFYGMNVSLPFQESPYAFAFIVISTITVSLISLIIFSRKDWL